jgi:hypothetical protein
MKGNGAHMNRFYSRRDFLGEISSASISLLCLAGSGLADVGGAEAAGKRSRVIASCVKHWPDNQGDCSAFVRAVAKDLGFHLSGNANDIYGEIAKNPWIQIGVGASASVTAGISAGEGKFVIAAEESQGHGHVAVVVDYRNAFDSYPQVDRNKAVAFWGKLNSVGKEFQRITLSWTAVDLQKVLFAYQVIP